MSPTHTRRSEARQRIITTAERLFYAEGIRAVGIDRIIAEAGVAKMTLYNHFPSKDDLILAVLEYREEKFDAMFAGWMEQHIASGLKPVAALFAALKSWFESPGFRGCAFINASVELADPSHPASQFSSAHKERFHQMIRDVVVEQAGRKAASISSAIALLIEGAIVAAVMQQSSEPATVAARAAEVLVPQAAKSDNS